MLHGSARTTPRVRAELQAAQASSRTIARAYGVNPKTVLKWRNQDTTADATMGPKPRSTTLTGEEEAMVVEVRRRILLPLDDVRRSSWNDVMGCLKDSTSTLTRNALHRCFQRHGISRPPKNEEASSKRKRFNETRIGYVHVDSCELRSAEGKPHMVLAIDRVTKFAYVAFHDSPGRMEGFAFLRGVIAAFPYQIRRVLTDNREAIPRRDVSEADRGVAFTRNASTKWDTMSGTPHARRSTRSTACATNTASSTG